MSSATLHFMGGSGRVHHSQEEKGGRADHFAVLLMAGNYWSWSSSYNYSSPPLGPRSEETEFALLPSEDFNSLDDYIDCLRNDLRVPAMDVEVNGGAQFRRLMFEVEVFCR